MSPEDQADQTNPSNRVKDIAVTIFHQLGGQGFAAMVGMITPILVREDRENGEVTATFRWNAESESGLNLMEITLVEALDTYRVVFGRIHGTLVTRHTPLDDVYCEDLCPLFQTTTGLDTIPPRFIIGP